VQTYLELLKYFLLSKHGLL